MKRRPQHHKRTTKSGYRSPVLLVCLLLLSAISNARGQAECACSPPTYEFTFDFSLTCRRPGSDYPPGIAEVTCFITSFSADVGDLIPISVETISIIEADTDRVPIAQSAIEGNYVSGDTFTYSSVSALGNTSQIPQSIQLTITGTNAANSSLVQVWAIKFTNDCDVYPVLELGESFGWTEFTDLGTPKGEICPAAASSTPAPTPSFPIEVDTPAPTEPEPEETPEPTMEPEETPEPTVLTPESTVETPEPTVEEAATPEPTKMTDPPTNAPSVEPTKLPTIHPTIHAPSLVPTTNSKEKTPTPKGGKEPDTPSPTILPYTSAPSRPPSRPPTKPPKETAPTTDELEPPPTEMSFSYYIDLEEEDYDLDTEWGRPSKKKDKKARDDSKDMHGRVRMGQRRRHY